ncbi:MAG TPA: hypothetical protein DDZ22_16330, partial [Massilia sp.]|nr:hypothetical protein [Massilia sp.]
MTVSVPTANAAFLLDESGAILTWNTACERLLMLPADRAIGCSLTKLLAAETPAAAARADNIAPMTVPPASDPAAADVAANAIADTRAVQDGRRVCRQS